MEFNLKSYQTFKTKHYLKKNNFLLFTLGANQNSQNWITFEQNLHKLGLSYYKTYNNITIKTLEASVYKNLKNFVKSTFFFLKPKQNPGKIEIIKYSTINMLNSTTFAILNIKLNKKIYTMSQLKTASTLTYKKNISIMHMFLLTSLKFSKRLKKIH